MEPCTVSWSLLANPFEEHQEERLKAWCTSLETKDGYYRLLRERLDRADSEGQFEQLEKTLRVDRQVLQQEVSSLSANSRRQRMLRTSSRVSGGRSPR